MKNKMIFLGMALMVVMAGLLTGCNKQLIDTTYNYDRAIIELPDGSVVSGEVDSWTDYSDGDQIQVKINGTSYLVHSEDIVLIAE